MTTCSPPPVAHYAAPELDARTAPELTALDDDGFRTLQAQLATQGVELHRVTGAYGREAFTVRVDGVLHTIDTLPGVQAWARGQALAGLGQGAPAELQLPLC